MNVNLRDYSDICIKFYIRNLGSIGIRLLLAYLIFNVNLLYRFVLKKLSEYRRFANMSTEIYVYGTSIFFAMLINSLMVFVFMRLDIEGLEMYSSFAKSLEWTGTVSTKVQTYWVYPKNWYKRVGITIIITRVIEIFFPHGIVYIFRAIKHKYWLKRLSRKLSGQTQVEVD
jgi:hypothetical protein